MDVQRHEGGVWRLIATVIILLVLGTASAPGQSESLDDLNVQVTQLYRAGKYAQAVPIARKYADGIKKKFGDAHPKYATALKNFALLYFSQGHYTEAEPLYKRALAIREKALGPDHPLVGMSLNNLAELYRAQGRYGEAEPLYKRSLAIREKALNPDHPDVGTVLNNLAELYRSQGRYGEAEPLHKRSLAILEKALGPDHPRVGAAVNNLAELYRRMGRYAEAEPLYKRSLAITEKALGPDHPHVGASLNNLAELYQSMGRYGQAEPLFKRSLAITEKALGPDHPDVGTLLNNLAELYRAQGRYGEAEPLYKRSLGIYEKALGPDHPLVATSLNNLALLYEAQGRYGAAEPLYKRSLTIYEKALGPDHPKMGTSLDNLALLYQAQGRYGRAEPLYQRSLAIFEKALGPDHPDVGNSLNNLARLYLAQGRYRQAEPIYQRSLAITEKALGPDHPDVGTLLNNLAELYRSQGRYGEAEPLQKRSLAIREKALGPDHPSVGTSLNNLAALYFVKRDWARATQFLERGTQITVRRTKRGGASLGKALTGATKSEASRTSLAFSVLVKAAYRLAQAEKGRAAELGQRTFRAAQWGQGSEAAASLAQMAARQAKGDSALARLVRERQDLVSEWQGKDKRLTAARTQPPARRNPATERGLSRRLAAIDARFAEIDTTLAKDFPDYAALANPAPLSIASVQQQLRDDEALVLFLDTPEWKPTPEETFIWVVTKTKNRWVRVELGTKALSREVQAHRCGLDYSGWLEKRCRKLIGRDYSAADREVEKPLPFDLNRSHKLYQALFAPIEDLIKGKELILVPSGPLTQLPFQVLVTQKPAARTRYADAAWLIKSHSLTILPSVSSLKALRQFAKTSRASRPYLGIGNPLLEGPDIRYAEWAKEAREKQSCPRTGQRIAALFGLRRSVALPRLRDVNVEHIKVQTPLPETADEVCAVAKSLNATDQDIRLGGTATENEIKSLSETGSLADYRVLHFATHGAMAGELLGGAEPGLILTPPKTGTERDNGYLSASEITTLKLNADWVILSACNTAAGGAEGAEALSGLARAFFYAGARALLVSHWSVASDPTVQLITGAFEASRRSPDVGRAEALRRSMIAMIDGKKQKLAHPEYWSPFILVGEGASGATSISDPTATNVVALPIRKGEVRTAEKNQQTEHEPGSRVCKQAFHVMRDGVCVDIR